MSYKHIQCVSNAPEAAIGSGVWTEVPNPCLVCKISPNSSAGWTPLPEPWPSCRLPPTRARKKPVTLSPAMQLARLLLPSSWLLVPPWDQPLQLQPPPQYLPASGDANHLAYLGKIVFFVFRFFMDLWLMQFFAYVGVVG